MAIHITASSETLLRQAPMTAHDFMQAAKSDIDEIFGDGYAKAHPELVGAYMKVAAIDLSGAAIARAVEEVAEAIQHFPGEWFDRKAYSEADE